MPADRTAGASKFKRGAIPVPRHRLLAIQPFVSAPPPMQRMAYVPKQLDTWGNDRYGDCVTAEEAFAKACYSPEIFIDDMEVIDWADEHGFLNGAMLPDVMDVMKKDGFKIGQQLYNDGNYTGVDYSNEDVLRTAICVGPVKIAIDANALPQGAGNQSGWYETGGTPGEFDNTDHCVCLCGHGPADWLYEQLGVPLPSALKPGQQGYLLFTWSTIGFVDHAWLMSTCTEAYVRSPTTIGVPPLQPQPTPTPPTPAPPTPTPAPTPSPWQQILVMLLPILIQLLQAWLSKYSQQKGK